jgi:rubredoxin-NAD+ reductase
MEPIIIIGAGLAGWTTVREFRKLDATRPVVVITADSGDFYAKPSLSNAYGQKRTPAQLVTTSAAKMAETLQVTLHAHTRVTSIDTAARTLAMAPTAPPEGAATTLTMLTYSQLVFATGALPIRVPVAGNAADQVRAINSLDDFSVFHSALSPRAESAGSSENHCKTVMIMGAGLIGCEFANDLLQAGHQVHVADPAPRPLAALLPAEAGTQLQEALAAMGVQWHFGTSVSAVDTASGAGLRVTLASGELVEADAVLSAIGLRADTALAAAAGLRCDRGIQVDALLQTSTNGIFALGDCAQYASAGERTLPYVTPIMNAAKALAATLNGTPTPLAFPLMPVSIKTPALPIVVAAPHPSQAGKWLSGDGADQGIWRHTDPEGGQRGFVLTGKQTARRMELAKATLP